MLSKLIPQKFGGSPLNYWNRIADFIKIHTYRHWWCDRDAKPFSDLVSKTNPRRILEIGVAQGWSAERMIKACRRERTELEYYGFDLFQKTFAGWSTLKDVVLKKLRTKLKVGKIRLYEGDSRKSLPKVINSLPKMDFIFIDGGHTFEVVKSDWENVKKLMHDDTVVVFDDYSEKDGWTKHIGVKQVVDSIKDCRVEFLPMRSGRIQAVVTKTQKSSS